MILSICIPTYNNPDILIENIVLIKKQLSKFQGDFEIVIGENFSNTENRNKILNISSVGIKFVLHESNIGFGYNLYKTMIEASGENILLLGDDDFPQGSLLTELIIYLNEKKDPKLFFLPLSTLTNPTQLESKSILPWVYMRSGSMMGLVFKKQSCVFDSSKFKQALYPQIDLAMQYVTDHGFTTKSFVDTIIMGEGDSLVEKFNDKMNRPIDFGVLERAKIIFRLHSKAKIDSISAYQCLSYLITWAMSIYFNIKIQNKVLAKKYIRSLFFGLLENKRYFIIIIYLLLKFFLSNTLKSWYKFIMLKVFSKKKNY